MKIQLFCFYNFFCAKSVVATFCPVRWERNGPIIKKRREEGPPPSHFSLLHSCLFSPTRRIRNGHKQTLEKCYFKKHFRRLVFFAVQKGQIRWKNLLFRGGKMQLPLNAFFSALLNPSQQDNQQRRNTTCFHPYSKRREMCFFLSDGPHPIFVLQVGGGGRRVGIKFREQSSLPESAAQEGGGKIETDAPYFFLCENEGRGVIISVGKLSSLSFWWLNSRKSILPNSVALKRKINRESESYIFGLLKKVLPQQLSHFHWPKCSR